MTEDDIKDQFYRQVREGEGARFLSFCHLQRVRSRARSIGKFEGRERVQKLKQIRQNTEANYQVSKVYSI